MPHERTPPLPEGAQADAEEWARFFDYFGHAVNGG
jgi:adenylate cyclase